MRTGRDLEDRIERLMESKGYAARREPSEHAGGKWIYRYASALGGAGTIEIDINYLFRGPLYGVDRMPSAAIGSYRATNVPVLDIHEIVAGKMVALVTRRAARDLFDAHRIIAMPSLDWAKIKAATLMIGASAKSFDWRTASPEAIGCEVGDITGKLTMCLHDRYFDRLRRPGGLDRERHGRMPGEARAAVSVDGRGEGVSGCRAGAGRDRCVFAGRSGIRARRDRSLSRVAMESAERQSLEIRRQVAGATHETGTRRERQKP